MGIFTIKNTGNDIRFSSKLFTHQNVKKEGYEFSIDITRVNYTYDTNTVDEVKFILKSNISIEVKKYNPNEESNDLFLYAQTIDYRGNITFKKVGKNLEMDLNELVTVDDNLSEFSLPTMLSFITILWDSTKTDFGDT